MGIRWSALSIRQLEEIYRQYKHLGRTVSQDICRNVYKEANLLTIFPLAGKIETEFQDKKSFRSLVVKGRRYKIIYYIENETIHIAAIWDCRRDPTELCKILDSE